MPKITITIRTSIRVNPLIRSSAVRFVEMAAITYVPHGVWAPSPLDKYARIETTIS